MPQLDLFKQDGTKVVQLKLMMQYLVLNQINTYYSKL